MRSEPLSDRSSELDRHKSLTVPEVRDLEEVVLGVTAAGKPRQFR